MPCIPSRVEHDRRSPSHVRDRGLPGMRVRSGQRGCRPRATVRAFPRNWPASISACPGLRRGPPSTRRCDRRDAARRGGGRRPDSVTSPPANRRSHKARSVSTSSALDRSSITSNSAPRTNMRAAAVRCTWPPESLTPRVPTASPTPPPALARRAPGRRPARRRPERRVVGLPEQDVLLERLAEQAWHLRRVRRAGRHEGGRLVHDVAVPPDLARLPRQQAQEGAQERGLARADAPRHHRQRASRQAQVHRLDAALGARLASEYTPSPCATRDGDRSVPAPPAGPADRRRWAPAAARWQGAAQVQRRGRDQRGRRRGAQQDIHAREGDAGLLIVSQELAEIGGEVGDERRNRRQTGRSRPPSCCRRAGCRRPAA